MCRSLLLALSIMLLSALPALADSFPHIWGGFGTSLLTRSEQQRHNTLTAARDLNGTVVAPGAVFSFNELVGGRDQSKGYTRAPFITADGRLEDTPGGGICQLASTIYNAGLLAGMQVVERHPHSRVVGHVPPGRDATISSWRKDLKLKNPFPHPLQLRIEVNSNRLTSSFRGPFPRPFQVQISTERIALEPETVIAPKTSLAPQHGLKGYATITRRTITQDGKVQEEVISHDSYPAPSRILGDGATP